MGPAFKNLKYTVGYITSFNRRLLLSLYPEVSSQIVLNMQNGGLGNNPRPAQATIKVLGRFLQSGDSAEPRIWN
jgi:hypothetical protein